MLDCCDTLVAVNYMYVANDIAVSCLHVCNTVLKFLPLPPRSVCFTPRLSVYLSVNNFT